MASRDGKKQTPQASAGRRLLVGVGAGAGVFFAAAAMATGSAVTAAPAHADFDDLIDPIIQPLLTSFTDALSGFDPAAATDITSWTDSLLNSLSSIDLALPSTADSAAAVAAAAEPAASTGTYDIPLSLAIGTEPTVGATVDGANNTLLVDTGSSGLVIPWQDLGSNDFQALINLFELGSPANSGFSGYSGGVDYGYLTYAHVPVDYGGGLSTDGPVNVEIYSFPTTFSPPYDFQQFLTDDHVTGILGIGPTGAGPATSPLEAAGYGGVTVNIPGHDLIVSDANPGSAYAALTGAPIINNLTETVTNSSGTVSTGTVTNDIDSGGVYGTIPQSIASSVAQGDKISVYDGGTLLYQYTVGTDSFGTNQAPAVIGTSNIDSGVEPYLQHPIYIDYATDKLYFDNLIA